MLNQRLAPTYQVSRRHPAGYLAEGRSLSGAIIDRLFCPLAFLQTSHHHNSLLVRWSTQEYRLLFLGFRALNQKVTSRARPLTLLHHPRKFNLFGCARGQHYRSKLLRGISGMLSRPTKILSRVIRRGEGGHHLATVPTTRVGGTRWLGGWPLLGPRLLRGSSGIFFRSPCLFGAVALTRKIWRLFRCQESMESVLDSSSGLSGRPISRVCPRLGSWQLVQCGGGSAGGFDRVFLRQTQVMAQ